MIVLFLHLLKNSLAQLFPLAQSVRQPISLEYNRLALAQVHRMTALLSIRNLDMVDFLLLQ
jgi:hypothetical protein